MRISYLKILVFKWGKRGGNLPKFRCGRDFGNCSENAAYLIVLSLGFFTFMLFILGFVFHIC